MAPFDRGPQRLLARLGISSSLQRSRRSREPLQDLAGREDARAGGGELDRERQVVQPTAELRDVVARLEPGAGAEELDRLRLRQRRHRILDLSPDTQQLPARHQEAEVRAGLEQRSELRSGLHHLLEVVQQQEQLALADVLGQAVLGPQRLGDGLGDEGRIAQSGEPDPEDAVPELRHQLGRRLDRQPRLPRTTRAGQRHQPRAILQQLDDVRHLPLPADERRRRPRQIRVRDRLQRRKALLAQLEDPHRLREVLHPVLAEIRQPSVDERARRLRNKHLAAVAGGGDPRRQVHVLADIALPADVRAPRMQAHAHADRTGGQRLLALAGGLDRLGPPTGTHRRTRPPACRPPPRRAARTPPATAAGARRAPPRTPPRPTRSAGA